MEGKGCKRKKGAIENGKGKAQQESGRGKVQDESDRVKMEEERGRNVAEERSTSKIWLRRVATGEKRC